MAGKKILLIIGIAILLVGIPVGVNLVSQTAGFSLGAKDPNRPENVTAISSNSQSVVITYITNKAVQGGISYGLSADSMTLFTPETGSAINHVININGLLDGKTYYYVIKINNQSYDNNGTPYSFNTKAVTSTLTPTPTVESSTPDEAGFISAFGTANPTYDLNKDGIVNATDLQLFREQNK